MEKNKYATISKVLIAAFMAANVLSVPMITNAQVPTYSVEFMGPGMGASINNRGFVIGNASETLPGMPWLVDDKGFRSLPIPAGMTGANVYDINDSGQIVGYVYNSVELGRVINIPAIWLPDSSGNYKANILPLANDVTMGTAVAINNHGDVLVSGNYRGAAGLYFSKAYVVKNGQVIDLGFAGPLDINDNGLVLGSNNLFDLNNMVELGLPTPPNELNIFSASPSSINNKNQISAVLHTTNYIMSDYGYGYAGVYTPDEGWRIIEPWTYNVVTRKLNDLADMPVGYPGVCNSLLTSGALMISFNNEGNYCGSSLLSADSQGWQISNVLAVSNDRTLVGRGYNSATNQSGIVKMKIAGGTPTPAPTPEPIPVPTPEPAPVPVVPDQIAPVVTFTNPQQGSVVSGVVTVGVNASDNSGIKSITVTANGLNCQTNDLAVAQCNWNTKTLPNGQYAIKASAVDTFGNATDASISVEVKNNLKSKRQR